MIKKKNRMFKYEPDDFITRDKINKDIDKILGLKNGRIIRRKRNKILEFIRKIFIKFLENPEINFNNRMDEMRKDIMEEINKMKKIRKKSKIIF